MAARGKPIVKPDTLGDDDLVKMFVEAFGKQQEKVFYLSDETKELRVVLPDGMRLKDYFLLETEDGFIVKKNLTVEEKISNELGVEFPEKEKLNKVKAGTIRPGVVRRAKRKAFPVKVKTPYK